MADWELKHCIEQECKMDDSGIYAVINRTNDGQVRIDIMGYGDMPIISFIGIAEAVRKTTMNWLAVQDYVLSYEHCSYIGSECARAELLSDYVQR